MAVKRSNNTSKKVSKAYQQAMVVEGAPALELFGFGSTIGDLIRCNPRKPAAKKRAKKKARAKVKTKSKMVRAKKKPAAGKSRRNR